MKKIKYIICFLIILIVILVVILSNLNKKKDSNNDGIITYEEEVELDETIENIDFSEYIAIKECIQKYIDL